ncbi:MAG: hypothetical protein ABIQ31_22630, partial [Ferruginibacter sp.]
MKNIFFNLLFFFVVLLVAIASTSFYKKAARTNGYTKNDVISCGTVLADIAAGKDGKFISVLPGWGNHGYTISTGNDSTQLYFDQGLSFYFSYHFREALASFKE